MAPATPEALYSWSDAAVSSVRAEAWYRALPRRAVSVPLYLLAATLVVGGAPLWLCLSFLADVALPSRGAFPRTRALLFLCLYLVCEIVGVLAAVLLTPVALAGRDAVISANAALQRAWTAALFHGSVRIFGFRVEVEGQDLARQGPMLLFVRHTSTADTVIAAALVANPNKIVLRYVLKRELLWDPCLDIVGQRLPNTFVRRDGAQRDAEIQAVVALTEGLDARSAVLIYPEGTRFSKEKLAKAVEGLRGRGLAALADRAAAFRHVLPPRLGGPVALLDATDCDVVLVEHAGFEGAASMREFWGGGLVGRTIRVRLRRFPATAIPRDDREGWLFDRWAEMDAWVEAGHQGQGEAPISQG